MRLTLLPANHSYHRFTLTTGEGDLQQRHVGHLTQFLASQCQRSQNCAMHRSLDTTLNWELDASRDACWSAKWGGRRSWRSSSFGQRRRRPLRTSLGCLPSGSSITTRCESELGSAGTRSGSALYQKSARNWTVSEHGQELHSTRSRTETGLCQNTVKNRTLPEIGQKLDSPRTRSKTGLYHNSVRNGSLS